MRPTIEGTHVTQYPHGGSGSGQGASGPQLPDFQGTSRGGATTSGATTSGATTSGPSDGERPRHPLAPAVVAGTLGGGVVLLLVVALVLSLTVFRPSDDPLAGSEHSPETEEPAREPAGGEYIPEGEESQPAAETTHIEAPTTPCEFLRQDSTSPQSSGTRSSGDLSFTIPDGWSTDIDWGDSLPHATDVATAEKHIELQFYSVAQVGQVDWSAAESEYPGAEDAAAAYLQCHLTRADGVQAYGENPELTGYRSEPFEVDGHDGWMVRGIVDVVEGGAISTYEEVEIVAVVVEAPSGPAVFKVATSADDPQLSSDLDSMIDSLTLA